MSGSRGNKATVYRASNRMETTSTKTFGVTTEPILPNQLGYVTTQGVVDGLDLGSYNSGDAVWLGSTPGTFTSQKPQAPSHSVFVGIVERANHGNGQLFVAIQNGYELDELHNVRIVNPTNGNLIAYDSSDGLWKNTNTISSSLTVSGSLNVRNLTVSGSFQVSSSLFQYSDNTDADIGTEVVVTVPTSSYRSAFFDYVVISGSNARSGIVFSVWGGSSVEYTELSTNDIGNTNPVSLFAALNGANIELRATTTADNWSVKSLVRML
jgi:hypothetical protein